MTIGTPLWHDGLNAFGVVSWVGEERAGVKFLDEKGSPQITGHTSLSTVRFWALSFQDLLATKRVEEVPVRGILEG